MTPTQDWTALDTISEKEAKVLLRMAVANFRIIKDTVKDPMKSESYSQEGHAQAAGLSFGFLMTWEDHVRSKEPRQAIEG